MIRALPDLLSTSLFSRVTSELKSDLDRSAIEAVTGRRTDVAEATAGRTGQVHRVQQVIDQADATRTRLALVTGRYTQASSALDGIRKATATVGDDALQAAISGNTTGIATSADAARGALASVVSALNSRFDGRSLFGGDAASVSPIADANAILADIDAIVDGAGSDDAKIAAIDAYFGPGGAFETSMYQGGSTNAAPVTLPDGSVLPPIDRADADVFRDMMKGLSILATSFKLPPVGIVDWVRQGANLIRGAQDELAISEARLGESMNRLTAAVEGERDKVDLAAATLDRIVGRDAFEAASEVQNLENRLQAAYSLANRIGRLSLTNYLR
jgi:flagellar hook-associated protein 3 FlgL